MVSTAAQTRVIDAALGLFAEHGVHGTSLQMIADAMGVTKAAVYHQFQSKQDIVLAVMELELAKLASALDAAEAETDRSRAVKVLVEGIVEVAVERRWVVGALEYDPVVVRLLRTHEPFPELFRRLNRLLAGPAPDVGNRTAAAMFLSAVGGAVTHPLVADVDDDTLRAHMVEVALKLVAVDPT